MSAFVGYIIVIGIIVFFRSLKKRKKRGNGSGQSRNGSRRNSPARSTDGHMLRGKQDITCRQFGHVHPEDTAPRFIVHDDPEDGYILLNGIKMRISEADDYENKI